MSNIFRIVKVLKITIQYKANAIFINTAPLMFLLI